jgi:hypothetical protein
MFETGLWGVEGKPVGLEKLPRRSLSKDEGNAARGVRHKLLTFVYGAESELKEVRFVRKQQQIGYQ